MSHAGDVNREFAAGAPHDFAGAQDIATGWILDRKALEVDDAQSPIASGRRAWPYPIGAARIQRASGIVGPRNELKALAERERNLAAAGEAGASIGIGVDRARLRR